MLVHPLRLALFLSWDCGFALPLQMHFGVPTAREKECWNHVLKGHIAMDSLVWPKGLAGSQLDAVARLALWKQGLDYQHGTGHGVGAFLNVHEDPQRMSLAQLPNPVAFDVGMTLRNEPGYYEDGCFGIRHENILVVKKATTPNSFGSKPYLGFEHLSMVPFQRRMVPTYRHALAQQLCQ